MATRDYIEVSIDVTAVPMQLTGAGRYTYELANALSLRGDMRPLLIARKDDEMRWEELPGSARVTAVAPSRRPLRLAWEQTRLPGLLTSLSPDLHHGPHYTIPERSRLPKVTTIHDMTFFDHPEWHEKSKVAFFRRAITNATKKADGLIAVSQYTADRLQDRFGSLDVTVIPHGVDHNRFKPTSSEQQSVEDRALLNREGVSGKFIAFVGTLEPRKDVPSLIKAFDRLADSDGELQLVLAGRDGWGLNPIESALSDSPHRDRIVRVGYLDDQVVPALYRTAAAVCYPSIVEGFGLPALEALACGAALVSTKGSAIEEVVENGALLVKPGNVKGMSEALHDAIYDRELNARLRERGPVVASRFTWKASAEGHVQYYRKLVRG